MPQSSELQKLSGQIEALKDASLFEAHACANAVMETAQRVLLDFDTRIARVEKFLEGQK